MKQLILDNLIWILGGGVTLMFLANTVRSVRRFYDAVVRKPRSY